MAGRPGRSRIKNASSCSMAECGTLNAVVRSGKPMPRKAQRELAALQQQFAAVQNATTYKGTAGKAKSEVSPNARSLIVAPPTTLAPAGATDAALAAPPFCLRSFTASR